MKLRNILLAAAAALTLWACDDDEAPKNEWETGLTVKKEVALAGTTPQTLNIKAPTTPTLTTDAAWLHIGTVASTGTGIYSAQLQADENTATEPRTATINVTAGSLSATVNVTQHAGDYIKIDEITPGLTLDPNGGTLTIAYTASAAVTVTAPEWLTLASNTDGLATLSYGINTGEARSADIELAVSSTVKALVSVSQEPAAQQMGSTAAQIAVAMHHGTNIGNTMEATGGEGSWTTKVRKEYIDGVKALGFNAVRIPYAVDTDYIVDRANNTIDPAWLDRIDEVVGWVVSTGMYAIVNIHWDGGWLENTCKDGYDSTVDQKQHDYWTQIANKLNHYDEHLLFAAMNEPNHTDNASTDAIMAYQQTMLDAVRATGGNNATRVLVMQVPNTNIALGCEGYYHMPVDVVDDRLMVEAHYYDTYQFNMMETDANWGKAHWYWGAENLVEGSDRNSPHGEADVRASMQQMKTAFVDKGYPGIIGEYAVCCDRSKTPGIDVERWKKSVTLWNRVVTRECINAGLVPFFWETGNDINRLDGKIKNHLQLDGVLQGAEEGVYPF